MKKIISFVLALVIVLSSFFAAFAAEESFYVDKLKSIGAIEGDENGNLHLEDNIIRAEAAALLVKLKGKKAEGAVKQTTAFSDVAKDMWYSGYVAVAHNNKYIDGVGDGKFNPEAYITMDEAATMVLKVLGYSADKVAGTWPENYKALAAEKNITDGITLGSQNATRSDFFRLIYNCLSLGIAGEPSSTDVTTKAAVEEVSAEEKAEAEFIKTAKYVTLAAFVGKYETLSTNEDVDIQYYAQFKTNGTNYVATYEISENFYNTLSAIGQTFAINVKLAGKKAVQEYKCQTAVVGQDICPLACATNTDGNVYVADGEICIKSRNFKCVLSENPMIYKYDSEGVASSATLDDVASSATVAIYDSDDDGFADIILLDFYKEPI